MTDAVAIVLVIIAYGGLAVGLMGGGVYALLNAIAPRWWLFAKYRRDQRITNAKNAWKRR